MVVLDFLLVSGRANLIMQVFNSWMCLFPDQQKENLRRISNCFTAEEKQKAEKKQQAASVASKEAEEIRAAIRWDIRARACNNYSR